MNVKCIVGVSIILFGACAPNQVEPSMTVPARRVLIWAIPKPGAAYTVDGFPLEVIHRKTGIEMVYIPAGSFEMGSSKSDAAHLRMLDDAISLPPASRFDKHFDAEVPRHLVHLSISFYLSKYEMTNATYRKWKAHTCGEFFDHERLDGDRQPVVNVSWTDAAAYCGENDLRMPTEAEWEYAARAGTTTIYPWGDGPNDGRGWANVLGPATNEKLYDNCEAFEIDDGIDSTAEVGRFRANSFGLYDMIGNVWEWCADWYSDVYYQSFDSGFDPKGPLSGKCRVLRGGSFFNGPLDCRVACREYGRPDEVWHTVGFRVARDL